MAGGRLCTCCVILSRTWGLGFWIILLAKSAIDLSTRSLTLLPKLSELTSSQWIGLSCSIIFFVFCAYRCMLSWSACLVLRSLALDAERGILHHILAPVFVGGFYHATVCRMVKAFGLVIFIVAIGIVVSRLAFPWREIVDAGVVVNLVVGTLALCTFSTTTYYQQQPCHRWGKPDFPQEKTSVRSMDTAVGMENGRTEALVSSQQAH
mmetsp:Transcript_9138/g.19833  ORF Transcript_9138/g.19833 Transcript_9138/m.19833 type:complete len:208 (+) Transcript_9138:110-733(+)